MTGKAEIDGAMMERCWQLARRAESAGNAAIGSLVAIGDRIVSEAEEETPAGPTAFAHAELLAVQRARRATGRRHLPEATLYSTHEPCFLCSYAVRASRIGRLVLDHPVADIGGATSAYPILCATDITIWGPRPTVVWWTRQETED